MNTWSTLKQRWASRPLRERRMLLLGAVVVATYLLWTGVWQPSWRVWRDAPQQRAQTSALLQSLQSLRAQAEHWRAQPDINRAGRDATLQSLAKAVGVTLQPQAQGWRVDLKDWSAEQLGQWLVDVQQQAHSTITQTQLSQDQGLWRGWMIMATESTP